MQSIPYSTLQQELDIIDLRELEDLIIEAIYAGIIQAKLDQKNAKVHKCTITQRVALHYRDTECWFGYSLR